MQKEVAYSKSFFDPGQQVETVYFGGGTPSLLEEAELNDLINSVKQTFDLSPTAEITLEANPDDCSHDKIRSWQQTGINRISLGVQSFNDSELKWMNRAHTSGQSVQSIKDLLAASFFNISVDLIFGSPLLDDETLRSNLQHFITSSIPHVSAYALTIEPQTKLAHLEKTSKKKLTEDEKQARHMLIVKEVLEQAGYEQYEISNYSLPGMRSRHNSSYWSGEQYLGIGPSAHSFNGTDTRRWNISNNHLYINQVEKGATYYEEEILSVTQRLNEYLMTSIRTCEGINITKISGNWGEKISDLLLEKAEPFIQSGSLKRVDSDLRLTRNGLLFADAIASDLFFD